MELIADKGLKVDFHIHSVYSRHKDGDKVDDNTLKNVETLIEKLVNNEVNICAITDHDTFNYNIYEKLKKTENTDNSILKVLPGVEFSVHFGNTNNKVIHVVTIFKDNDENKIKNIENVLKLKKGKPQYDYLDVAFSEDMYLSILKDINLDTIMIAHQKNSLTSEGKQGKNDALSLGKEKFNEFLFTDYFEAFEFRNKKNEIFNKKYILKNGIKDNLRFITGSDCHDWSVYPNVEKNSTNEFCFTYMKCLPTFRGVVMAMTDQRRIKLVNSFFNPNAFYLDKIKLKIIDEEIDIPLSRGINVIIGDNSIGKSLLVHKLTNYIKLNHGLLASAKKGYEKYLKENKVQVITQISDDQIFHFDMQGYVRKLFEENNINRSEFLHLYFPEDIDAKVYRLKVENELEKFFNYIKQKLQYDVLLKELSMVVIKDNTQSALSVTFLETLEINGNKEMELNKLVTDLAELKEILKKFINLSKVLEADDLSVIKEFKLKIDRMEEKYIKLIDIIQFNKKKLNIFNSFIKDYKENYSKQISDEQKTISDYIENKSAIILDIVKLVAERLEISEFKPNIENCTIEPKINKVFQYNFVAKLKLDVISNEYITELIEGVLKKDKKINTTTISADELKSLILYYPNGLVQPLEVLKDKIKERLNDDFSQVKSILFEGMDKFKELSTGLDSQIYFTLLSYESRKKGIYIIDQPEDDISQKAIRNYLLDRFKTMGEYRQVIMITHNPQFIVNLDVDNVIFLSKEKDKLCIKSGSLEYENDKYSILKVVADNIDGGLDTIERRLKRYEKGI